MQTETSEPNYMSNEWHNHNEKKKEVNQVILNMVLRYTFSLMQILKWGRWGEESIPGKEETQGPINIFLNVDYLHC